jgi:hypothetical protein
VLCGVVNRPKKGEEEKEGKINRYVRNKYRKEK